MVLPLVQLPDERLHQSSALLNAASIPHADFAKMLTDMEETMYYAKGVGIAGVQVGYCHRVFLALRGKKVVPVVNPIITAHGDAMESMEEGCLSVPGLYHPVERWTSVRLQGLNERGLPIELKARGYFARVLQHETDHLNGILFVDRFEQQQQNKK
ncbi:peptide deformylase [Candidatus Uhrbacteria bacterium]|nr:peptide deformylase [Candidatus Uhrbacteria bacterium]